MRALLLALIVTLCGVAQAQAQDSTWRITKDHWDAADEAGFSRFVNAIGELGCSSTESCLRSPANVWRNSDARFQDIDVDCAKLPYLLRAYYAWKNGLPFSYVDDVAGSRYGAASNRVVSRKDLVDAGAGMDGPRAIQAMLDNVYSATYRTDAADEKSDFYSPAIQPGSIRSGTVIYDANGHIGLVYKVDSSGRIYYMDAHPDFTISHSVYGAQFGQSRQRLGGGLKNWRPQHLVGAHWNGRAWIGGHIVLAANDQIADFSLLQYRGNDGPNGIGQGDGPSAHFSFSGVPLGFYEYVRAAVSGGRTDYNPVYELEATMRTLCNDLGDRAQFVSQAVSNGVAARLHPSSIPDDIYNSDDGTWESFATPARDARLKAGFVQFRRDLGKMMALWTARDPRIVYDGQFLKDDLLHAYDRESAACVITYLSSDKRPVTLSFDDIVHRLFALSFDPYHCIELRWGDDSPACPDQAGKRRWYAVEEQARHDLGRDAGENSIANPRDVDIRGLIASMPERTPFVQKYPGQ